ncbi:hypothetical protein HOF65_01115 [bacterium]|nr:hypothetical protein [bacterium]MBT3852640.1 hypothetical protein [bacterium]MBT4633409.1 hypothetical protein [bacterium]MBT6778830.1 hypothetical protein [bacterium]
MLVITDPPDSISIQIQLLFETVLFFISDNHPVTCTQFDVLLVIELLSIVCVQFV